MFCFLLALNVKIHNNNNHLCLFITLPINPCTTIVFNAGDTEEDHELMTDNDINFNETYNEIMHQQA